MKPSTKFGLGAAVIVASVALLMIEGVKQTGTYFLTPSQLVERTAADPGLHDVGLKVSAKVVRGSIARDAAAQQGKFGRDGVFHATDVIAKCGSRYEAEWDAPAKSA